MEGNTTKTNPIWYWFHPDLQLEDWRQHIDDVYHQQQEGPSPGQETTGSIQERSIVKLAHLVDSFYKLAISISDYSEVRKELTPEQQEFFDGLHGAYQGFLASEDPDYRSLRGNQLLQAIDYAIREIPDVVAQDYLRSLQSSVMSEMGESDPTMVERLEGKSYEQAQWRDVARLDQPSTRRDIMQGIRDIFEKRQRAGKSIDRPDDTEEKAQKLREHLENMGAPERLVAMRNMASGSKFETTKHNPFAGEWSTLDLAWALNELVLEGIVEEAARTTKMHARKHNIDPTDLEKLMMR